MIVAINAAQLGAGIAVAWRESVHPTRQRGPHAHSVAVSPDNRGVVIADLGSDKLVVAGFDVHRGRIEVRTEVAARQGSGPRTMAFPPNGAVLYVAHELDSTIGVFPGTLCVRGQKCRLPAHCRSAWSLVVLRKFSIFVSNARVAVSNRGHDSIALFRVRGDGLSWVTDVSTLRAGTLRGTLRCRHPGVTCSLRTSRVAKLQFYR